jgi:DNA-binding response OmpR family regulator
VNLTTFDEVSLMKQKGRILIVDDDSACVDVLCRILQGEYRLEAATNGGACLAKLFLFKPQLVLLDVKMPGINGHETCRRIKLSPVGEHVQIILVSGEDTILDKERGSDILADDFIIKPFDHDELVRKVRAQFCMREMPAELLT